MKFEYLMIVALGIAYLPEPSHVLYNVAPVVLLVLLCAFCIMILILGRKRK